MQMGDHWKKLNAQHINNQYFQKASTAALPWCSILRKSHYHSFLIEESCNYSFLFNLDNRVMMTFEQLYGQ